MSKTGKAATGHRGRKRAARRPRSSWRTFLGEERLLLLSILLLLLAVIFMLLHALDAIPGHRHHDHRHATRSRAPGALAPAMPSLPTNCGDARTM